MMGDPILDQYISSSPSNQNALDIFKGEWSSRLPGGLAELRAGQIPLFEDSRIEWAVSELGGLDRQTVLELGPLEAGHTYMLESRGAASIISIEANVKAYLKCLIVKEIVGLSRARFLCGDFIEYLRNAQMRFDVCFASGVLYHMVNPVELIALIARSCDRLFIWTHYYDPVIVNPNPRFAPLFTGQGTAEWEGFRHTLYRREYEAALNWGGFCGGSHTYSHWLTREDVISCLKHFGFRSIRVNFDDPAHPNGPSFALIAFRS